MKKEKREERLEIEDMGHLFLKKFIEAVLVNIVHPSERMEKYEQPKKNEPSFIREEPQKTEQKIPEFSKNAAIPSIMHLEKDIEKPKFEKHPPKIAPVTRPMNNLNIPSASIMNRKPLIRTNIPKYPIFVPQTSDPVEKISFFLRDPSISSIECPGPGKNLIIKKKGIVQFIDITLRKEEIDKILEWVSFQTRIPLVQGTFKAFMGNLLITAIISNFVGSRFIIEKKIPLEAPVQIGAF